MSTIGRVRQRFVEEGLEAALRPRPSPRVYARKLDGAQEAKLVALACSGPPEGTKRWTLRLLAERMVELEIVPELIPAARGAERPPGIPAGGDL